MRIRQALKIREGKAKVASCAICDELITGEVVGIRDASVDNGSMFVCRECYDISEAFRGAVTPRDTQEGWRIERREAITMLRSICHDYGDNDWPDDLHITDIIDKHLYRHLVAVTKRRKEPQ